MIEIFGEEILAPIDAPPEEERKQMDESPSAAASVSSQNAPGTLQSWVQVNGATESQVRDTIFPVRTDSQEQGTEDSSKEDELETLSGTD